MNDISMFYFSRGMVEKASVLQYIVYENLTSAGMRMKPAEQQDDLCENSLI